MSSSSKFVKWIKYTVIVSICTCTTVSLSRNQTRITVRMMKLNDDIYPGLYVAMIRPSQKFRRFKLSWMLRLRNKKESNKANSYDGDHTSENIKPSNQNTPRSTTFKSLVTTTSTPTTMITQQQAFLHGSQRGIYRGHGGTGVDSSEST